ncbi:MAG: hypothetical protein COA35_007720 [Colwellia sp.]|nr:hypothetical protein [Colwellia sp.]|tara:strand:+ start:297 stop:821 length:525 start_codon:yes stop_codon:yes gene_type:complete
MRAFLPILLAIITLQIKAEEGKTYTFNECRFSIELTSDWYIEASPKKDSKCELHIINNKSHSSVTELYVSLGRSEFLNVASSNGFDYFKGDWVTLGRQSSYVKASEIQFGAWIGVKGKVHSGCHNGSGYIGICSHYSVVIREAKLIDGTVILIRGRAINEQILKSTYETIKPVF